MRLLCDILKTDKDLSSEYKINRKSGVMICMDGKKVRVGVVGLGNMGSCHLESISGIAAMELTACCDILPDRAEQFGKKYNVPYFTSADAMMESGLLDAIVIAVPHYDHTTIAVSAFAHNLHVLTEKPVAVHKNDALKMIRAHEACPDKLFAAMFQMRLQPVYIRLRELIQRGELGKIQRINWIVTGWFRSQAYYDSGTWRATWKGEGGGVLLNQCPHHIDLFQWLFGMPAKVRANCAIGKYHHIEVEDDVTAYFEYPDGSTAVFITSTGEAPGTNRLEITCDRGRVVLEGSNIEFLRNEITTSEYCATTDALFGFPPYWVVTIPINAQAPANPHKVVLENFADAILNGTPLIAPAEEGLKSVELANSMLYSSMNNTEVNLPLDGDAYEKMLFSLIENSTFRKNETTAGNVDMSASFGK